MRSLLLEKTSAEIHWIQITLDRFLVRLDISERQHARQIALSGILHALQTKYLWLSHSAQIDRVHLLEKQIQLAETVASRGGINDTALKVLYSNGFKSILNYRAKFADWPADSPPPDLYTAKPTTSSFDPLKFFPCVVGSGRLAAAFLAGFYLLGVPTPHITLVSLSPLTETSLATWLSAFLGRDINISAYRHFKFEDNFDHKFEHVFLLIKKKGFENLQARTWLQNLRQRNPTAVLLNLMAGGPLDPLDRGEIAVRSNVLVAYPGGGNLLVLESQMKSDEWRRIETILNAMGQVIPVASSVMQSTLTFFTSTLPLIFFAEVDKVYYQNMRTEQANFVILWSDVERIQVIRKIIDGQSILGEQLDPKLDEMILQYMKTYLDGQERAGKVATS